MNKEILRVSAKEHMRVLFISFCLLSGTAVSLYLSIAISAYFYLLAVLNLLAVIEVYHLISVSLIKIMKIVDFPLQAQPLIY